MKVGVDDADRSELFGENRDIGVVGLTPRFRVARAVDDDDHHVERFGCGG